MHANSIKNVCVALGLGLCVTSGTVSAEELCVLPGGALKEAYEQPGWTPLIGTMSLISLNLGIFNLLPIPILDGGMILFLLIESVMRRDLNQQVKERVYQVAFVCLIVFAAMVIFNDITKLSIFAKVKP